MFVSALTCLAFLSQRLRVRVVLTTCALFVCFTAAHQVVAQSALDGFDPNANGTIRAFVIQADGKILIGGEFTTVLGVARNRIARLNPDGTLDTSFDPNANNFVFAMAVQSDGKILAGGLFTSVSPNGGAAVTRNRVARFNADGNLDTAFDPNIDSSVFSFLFSIVLQTDNKILVGGQFPSAAPNGGPAVLRNNIARLNADGTVDPLFDPNVSGEIYSIAVQTNGKIVIVGNFSSVTPNGGVAFIRFSIARLNPDGTIDTTFSSGANQGVFTVAVQADGKILVGGLFTGVTPNGGASVIRNRIARFNANGTLDTTFDPNANNTILSIVIQPDGKILAGGNFTGFSPNGGAAVTRNNIARINMDGTLDTVFNPNASGQVDSMAVQEDGKILVGGIFTIVGGQTRNRIARLERDGTVDQTLDLNMVFSATTEVVAIAVQPDGKILIGGVFTSVLGVTRNNIARLNANGTLDMAFDPNANGDVIAIAVQADGNILASGRFTNIGSAARNRIARLDAATGAADLSFNPDANELVFSIVPLADGKILVGGRFSGVNSIGGATRNRIARLNSNGTADSFNPDANNDVFVISVQTDGMILAGGRFTTIGGVTRNRLARLDSGGVLDSFNPDANNTVNAIAVQPDGKILAGGSFTSIGATTRNRIARLDSGGTVDAFNPDANAGVNAIAVQTDGKILVSGDFTIINTLSRIRIARLDPGGTVDSFNPNPNNNNVFAIALQTDGKVLVGGRFTTIGGQARSLFARLTNDTAALQNLAVTQTAVTWTRDGASPNLWRVVFEQSTDGGANYTFLGDGTGSFARLAGGKGEGQFAPTASNWTLTGLALTTGQNIHIRARGFYRTGHENASDSITETVKNVFLLPSTAASVSISGRVLRGKRYSVGNAVVSLTGSSGSPRQARTGSFGYYRFDNVDVGQTYIISVLSKRYQFEPQLVFVMDDIGDLDFIALP